MSKDLIRLMHALFLPAAEACQDAPWRPNMDVYRTATGWLVKFELAGVRAEDIDLHVLGGRMNLQGIRRDTSPEGGSYYRMEIAYSRFERSVELPCDLKKSEVTTEYRDGMLLVHIQPHSEEMKAEG
jgi:HSP20 family protein